MTYTAAYKLLEANGTIDQIIANETRAGFGVDRIKGEIISQINYATEFFNGKMFKEMRFWVDKPTRMENRVTLAVLRGLAKAQLGKNARKTQQYEYLLKQLEGVIA